jgi:phenylalanyl-tRNA synthetase beta chain
MKVLSAWLREFLPPLDVTDRQLAEDLTLRGIAVEGIFDLGANRGHFFEMDITTNRVDAMNHYGIAREIATIYNVPLRPLSVELPAAKQSSKPFPVRIEAPDLCGRFTARVLRNVQVAPSSGIIAERFALLDQKQIWNAVDASNYALLAMGQPTHAFDLDKVSGGIVVRRARKGEKIKLLDGSEHILDAEDLVVADEQKALALAGVMGGWDSMIMPETKNVLVEAAWFDPAAIRRSSRRHGLHTDASHRFERGADFNAAPVANALVTQLILANGGEIEGELIDIIVPEATARTVKRAPVPLAVSEVSRILGTTTDGQGIAPARIEQILTALGCKLSPSGHNVYQVTLPSWRLDLEREIDLIEEVARVYSYNRFANTLPTSSSTVVELPNAEREDTLRRTLLALGFHEAISSTFASATDAVAFAPQPDTVVPLHNPLNEEAGVMRPSLVPGMLHMIEHNLNRSVADVRLFEMGTVFSGSTDRVDERPALSIGLTGAVSPADVHTAQRPANFYDVKGVLEEIASRFSMRSVYFDSILLPGWLHPGRAARMVVNGATVAYFGQLHPDVAHTRKIKQPVFVGEIYLDRLYQQPLRQPVSIDPPRFPAVERDFSFLFSDAVRWEHVGNSIKEIGIPTLVSTTPLEIFRDFKGVTVPVGHYSVLVRCVLQSPDRTLRDEEVQSAAAEIEGALTALGGKQRK